MKKIYMIILTVLICSFTVCGALAAADWYREDRTTNTISVGNLSAEIVDIYEQDTVVMPGDTVEKIVSVRNDGDSDELVRVRITGMWTDNGEVIAPDQLICDIDSENWLCDTETGCCYYKKVLSPGEVSEPLLRSFSISGPKVNNYFSYRPGVITIAMDAVQAAAGGASIWGKTNEELSIEYEERPELGENSESDVEFRGSDDGFDFGSDSDLFASFKKLLPGQTVIQNISVGNSDKESTEIFLKAECMSEDKDELLRTLLTHYTDVEIKAGGRTIYSGPLWRGDTKENLRLGPDQESENSAGGNSDEFYADGISLGTIDADSGTQVTVELKLSPEAGNEFQDLIGDVDWIFYAKGTGREPVPQTGDNTSAFFLYMIIAGTACLLLIMVRVIVSARERRSSQEKKGDGKWKSGYGIVPVVLAAIVAAGVLTASVTLAFMTDSETAVNDLKVGTLSIDLTEPRYTPGKVLEPGAVVPKDPTVTNTGTVPMLAYIRVNIPVKTVATVDSVTKKIIPAKARELFSFVSDNSWVEVEKTTVTGEDGNVYACYVYGYAVKALDPGEVSEPLFEEVRFLNILEGELEYGSEIDIPISAFGIQDRHVAEGGNMAERLTNAYELFVKEAWT